MKSTIIDALVELNACPDAVDWARTQPDSQAAWRTCDRGDWLLWLLGRTVTKGSPRHKRLVLVTCRIASDSLRYVAKGENRPRVAIRTTRRWAIGKASIEDVEAAGRAAGAAGAAWAARAAGDAAWAARAAAWAAGAARDAAWAAGAAARFAKLKLYARWVREEFPTPPTLRRGNL